MKRTRDPILVPGVQAPPVPPLQRYKLSEPRSVLSNAVTELTAPGDLLLHVAATAGTYVRETVNAGRRILSLNVNPIPLVWMHLLLAHPPKAKLSALLTRLGDIPKENRPFVRYVEDIYQSPCPKCGQSGVAEWLLWDRESQQPVSKRVRCPHCRQTHEGPITAQDVTQSERFKDGSGPAYYMALGRIANPEDPGRGRAAELVKLYTPRNLSLIFDTINRVQRLHLPEHLERSLMGLLLEALDQGSRLVAAEHPDIRPRSLRPARHYREQNVWLLLEAALDALDLYPDSISYQASTISDLLTSREPGYALSSSSLHTLIQSGYAQRFDALVLEIQPPDAVFWALSAMWSTWLWREKATSSVRGFLSRRRLTWDWYTRSLSVGLIQAKRLLRSKAHVLCVLNDDYITGTTALIQAADQADYHTRFWVGDPDSGYLVLLQPGKGSAHHRPLPLEACESTIRRRGEPTPADHLQVASRILSSDQSLNVKELKLNPRWTRMDSDRWWVIEGTKSETPLADGSEAPLADRIEHQVIEMLISQPTWQRTRMVREIYRQFNGEASPELDLVEACIDAYTDVQEGSPDRVTIREKDSPQAREAELRQFQKSLETLGRRLGYQVKGTASDNSSDDIFWIEGGITHYQFRCITSAILTPHLSEPPQTGSGQRCLVLPGSRAALIHLKLMRDPRLSQWLHAHRWRFVKFRHLRRMFQEVKHRSEIEVFLGLDPIIEQGQAQIPLPLEARGEPL